MQILKSSAGFVGTMVIKVHDSLTGKLLFESKPIRNKIISGSGGYGRNIVIRQLTGDTTYPIRIDGAIIGTGSAAPIDSDTGLQTPTSLVGISVIPVASTVISNDVVIFSFYITNSQLPNGTYSEFGLKCGSRLFSRVLISPTFTKGSNQNVTVDYTIQLISS